MLARSNFLPSQGQHQSSAERLLRIYQPEENRQDKKKRQDRETNPVILPFRKQEVQPAAPLSPDEMRLRLLEHLPRIPSVLRRHGFRKHLDDEVLSHVNFKVALDIVNDNGKRMRSDYWKRWLNKVAVNKACDLVRARRRTVSIGTGWDFPDQDMGDYSVDDIAIVKGAIGRLPEKDQDIIRMHCYEGKSTKLISAQTDIPLRSVQRMFEKAKARLRRELEKRGF